MLKFLLFWFGGVGAMDETVDPASYRAGGSKGGF